MSRNIFASLAFAGAAFMFAAPAAAEELSLHTFLLTWADENCEGFTYAEDMLRGAHKAVADAPAAEVAAIREKTEIGLNEFYDGDKVEYCQFVADSIEDLEAEAAEGE